MNCSSTVPGMLEDSYREYVQVVKFSATLKPFDYYARLSGLDPKAVRTAEFHPPFPKERRKLLVLPQISTRYAHRERNYGISPMPFGGSRHCATGTISSSCRVSSFWRGSLPSSNHRRGLLC